MLKTTLLAASAIAFIGMAGTAYAVPALGLSGGTSLFDFDTTTPGANSASRNITGLQGGETLASLDYRPANSVLYGFGTAGGLYTINQLSGAATLAFATGLSGTNFDIAFNPVVDRLRVVGVDGRNFRINQLDGTITTDGNIAYLAGDPNAGASASVTGVAYTNQVRGGVASTVLFDIDNQNSRLTTQAPPNNGSLNTVGPLGVSGLTSFDIDGVTNAGYAANASTFYTVNLASGAAAAVGAFASSNVTDFTIVPVPEPMSIALLGMGVASLAVLRRRIGPIG